MLVVKTVEFYFLSSDLKDGHRRRPLFWLISIQRLIIFQTSVGPWVILIMALIRAQQNIKAFYFKMNDMFFRAPTYPGQIPGQAPKIQ